MTRKKRTRIAQQENDVRGSRAKSAPNDGAPLAPQERLRLLRRRTFDDDAPLALRSYAAGAAPATVLVRAAVVDKLRFDALQSEVRRELGVRVTQLGMFALLVRLGSRRRRELVGLAGRDLTPRGGASP